MELTETRKYLVELTVSAGQILTKYFNSGSYSIKQKDGVDFTTQADLEVDAFLREHLTHKFKNCSFLTEETAPPDYSKLKSASNLWVIDPLDGTTNFSRKNSNFAISVALADRGKTTLGVVHLPLLKKTYWAQSDLDSAYLNDKPIHVSKTSDLREVVLACDWAWDLEKRQNIVSWLERTYSHVRQIKSMGSAASDTATLAEGKIDAYLHSGLKPWDIAASALLIEKAGGKITTPNGSEWDIFNPDILASNEVLHSKILDLINKNH